MDRPWHYRNYNFVATVQADALPHPNLSSILTFLFLIYFAHYRNGSCLSGLLLRFLRVTVDIAVEISGGLVPNGVAHMHAFCSCNSPCSWATPFSFAGFVRVVFCPFLCIMSHLLGLLCYISQVYFSFICEFRTIQ